MNDLKSTKINLSFTKPKTVLCQIFQEDTEIFSDTFISDTEDISLRPFFFWVYACIKDIFTISPTIPVTVLFNNSEKYPEALKAHMESLKKVILTTQKYLNKYSALRGTANTHSGKLFLNLGDTPYLMQLYKEAYKRNPEETFFDPCFVVNKQDDEGKFPPPTVETLIQTILEKKIGKIYSHNISYLSYFLEKNETHLLPIMELVGVEFIIIDFDTYNQVDGHYYLKSFLSLSQNRHFCIMPHIESYWDQTFNLKNIHYFPIPFYVTQNNCGQPLSPDFSIIITTWSRLETILYFLKPILFFLEHTDEKNIFYDYQMLFHSMVHILLKESALSHYEKMLYYKILSLTYYHANSLLKFEVLEKISTSRKIFLFGDELWREFFPDYYQRKLTSLESSNFSEILHGESRLHLLMNSNYHYFENNPMMIRVLNQHTPYLNFSSIVRRPEMEGMSLLEYSSVDELNRKIEQVPTLTSSPDYQASKKFFSQEINPCVDDFFQEALTSSQMSENRFFKISQAHQNIFIGNMIHYLSQNMNRVHTCLIQMLRKEYRHFNIQTSRYAGRKFFPKVMEFYEANKQAIQKSQEEENTL